MVALNKSSDQYKTVAFNKSVSEFRLKTLDGKGEIRVIKVQGLHTLNKTDNKAYVSMHGGANIGLSAIIDAEALGNMTFGTNCVMFFVDYRYAPYTKNPGQTEDVYVVIKELYTHPKKYGIDRNHIAAGGRSSGNTLALGAAIMLQKNNEEHMLHNLFMLLPSINNIMWTQKNAWNTTGWSEGQIFGYEKVQDFMIKAWDFSTNSKEQLENSIYVFPGKASKEQIARLPKTIVFTAEYDFYRPDAIDLAEKL